MRRRKTLQTLVSISLASCVLLAHGTLAEAQFDPDRPPQAERQEVSPRPSEADAPGRLRVDHLPPFSPKQRRWLSRRAPDLKPAYVRSRRLTIAATLVLTAGALGAGAAVAVLNRALDETHGGSPSAAAVLVPVLVPGLVGLSVSIPLFIAGGARRRRADRKSWRAIFAGDVPLPPGAPAAYAVPE